MRGFSIIEILIAVSIVALLSTIGLAVYTNVLKNARDSQRKTDIGFTQSALEQYFADQFYYPKRSENTTSCTTDGELTFLLMDCPLKNPAGTKTYLKVIPRDPTRDVNESWNAYGYYSLPSTCDNSTGGKCIGYCMYARMENTSNTAPPGCSFTGNYNFGVTVP